MHGRKRVPLPLRAGPRLAPSSELEQLRNRLPAGATLAFTLSLAAALAVGGASAAWARKGHSPAGEAKHGKGNGLADRATSLREQGEAALQKKDFAAAAAALSDSYRLSPEGKTLYLLGQLAWSSGKTVAAQDLMRRFLATPTSAGDPAAKAEAEKIVDQPRPASGDVLVVGERGALVSVDDQVAGMLPLPLPLLLGSGEHKVTLEVSGRRLEGPVRVLPGRTSEVRFNLTSDAVVARVVPAVVWIPEWKGVPAAAQKVLTQALEQSVAGQKLSAVSKGVALAQAPRLGDCLEQLSCLEQLATLNEVGSAMTTSVEATGDLVSGDWTMKLALVDAPTGDYAATLEKRCEHCTADQAGAALQEATTALLQKGATRPRGTLELLTDPPGADILLTERRLGQTPYLRAAFSGGYDVTIKLAGYPPVRQHVEVEEGKKASVRLTLTPEVVAAAPPPPPPPPVPVAPPPPVVPPPVVPPPVVSPPSPKVERGRRPVWRIATGATLLGVGALLGGYGISGLASNGDLVTVDGQPMRLQSQTAGGGFLGVGLLFMVGGAVMVALPGPRQPTHAWRLGGGGLSILYTD